MAYESPLYVKCEKARGADEKRLGVICPCMGMTAGPATMRPRGVRGERVAVGSRGVRGAAVLIGVNGRLASGCGIA